MESPLVIFLHGMARTAISMKSIEKAVKKSGFETLNINYPSRKERIPGLGEYLVEQLQEKVAPERPISCVTHSMGSLVARIAMSKQPERNWQSAVFVAPPSQGSRVAQKIGNHPLTRGFFEWFYGPAGQQLAKHELEIPLPICPVGVIAGSKSSSFTNPTSWVSRHGLFENRKSDGTVSVEETRLPDMEDFIILDLDHTTIMSDPGVHQLAVAFLRAKSFDSVRSPLLS